MNYFKPRLAYTFAPFKVLWKEMSGSRFSAAYVGSEHVGPFGPKVVVPDHKLYFVPVDSEEEAAFLTALLNARTVSKAISAYAAQLSLGVSVIEYLKIPEFNPQNDTHARLAELARAAQASAGQLTELEEAELDRLATSILAG